MIELCYSGNKKVFEGIMLSVLSMLERTEQAVKVRILTMDLTDQNSAFTPITESQTKILDEVLKAKNSESCAERTDLTKLYLEKLKEGKNQNTSYTPYTLLRLFLDVVPGISDKLIYTDVDTMFYGDVKELWDVDVTGYEFAASLDFMGRFWINRRYTNAGVMLLNLPEIRRTGLFRRSCDMVLNKKMILADQAAVNKLVKKKLILPMRFNEQRGIKPDTVVKHFCKGIKYIPFFHLYNIKQWDRKNVHEKLKIFEFDSVYAEYDALAAKYDFNA